MLMDRVECEGHEDSLADCPSVTPDRGASQDCKSVPPAVAVCRGKLPASTGVRVPGLACSFRSIYFLFGSIYAGLKKETTAK